MLFTTLLPLTVWGSSGTTESFAGELYWKKFDLRFASKVDRAILSISFVAVLGN